MTSNPIADPPGKVLAMLDDDPPMPERYTPDLIERLPLDDITARLGELGVAPAMPDRVRELVDSKCGPAEHLISLLDNEENTDLAAVERRPLPEVIAALDRLGTNHAAGLERIREILDLKAIEALHASTTSLKPKRPETTRLEEEHPKVHATESPRGVRLTAGFPQTTRRAANRGAGSMNSVESRDAAAEGMLLDTMAAAVKKLISRGKERGYVTYDEVNAALPQDQVSSELIEDTLASLSETGIAVVEPEENEDGDAPAAAKPASEDKEKEEDEESGGNVDEESLGRADDPVRMYLREMGSVELLSREGEIAIAKRIEAGGT